ncbi:hypothetical protein [Prochlorococcus marinus]|uniref:hypothetical protein n=1 Tax=Prochlorococcus marinus TaxID=1219 RepID=UPI0022B4A4E7|nr:hypothetical protein [Prochlorococcus marinus]
MSSISSILNQVRNLLPYLILIAIYFFFVNLEARKEQTKLKNSDMENIVPENKSTFDDNNMRIKIPVIPYDN